MCFERKLILLTLVWSCGRLYTVELWLVGLWLNMYCTDKDTALGDVRSVGRQIVVSPCYGLTGHSGIMQILLVWNEENWKIDQYGPTLNQN